MSFFDLSILDMLPKVVADGSEGGVHLYTEVAPESYWSFIYRAILFTKKNNIRVCVMHDAPSFCLTSI